MTNKKQAEKTPEQKISEEFNNKELVFIHGVDGYTSFRAGILFTLNTYGIKIKGVNDK